MCCGSLRRGPLKSRLLLASDQKSGLAASGIGTSQKGVVKIDPKKKPKWMDSTATTGSDKEKVSLGIYEIAGDDYKVCFAPPGKARPKAFSSAPGSGNIVQVWKREKR